jgi:hypothetical protein
VLEIAICWPNPVSMGCHMDGRDIYRSAKLLVDQFGADAAVEAAMHADAMLERGDMEGFAVWKRIVRAISEIRAADGQTKH